MKSVLVFRCLKEDLAQGSKQKATIYVTISTKQKNDQRMQFSGYFHIQNPIIITVKIQLVDFIFHVMILFSLPTRFVHTL